MNLAISAANQTYAQHFVVELTPYIIHMVKSLRKTLKKSECGIDRLIHKIDIDFLSAVQLYNVDAINVIYDVQKGCAKDYRFDEVDVNFDNDISFELEWVNLIITRASHSTDKEIFFSFETEITVTENIDEQDVLRTLIIRSVEVPYSDFLTHSK